MSKISLAIASDLHLGTPFAYLDQSLASQMGERQIRSLMELCKYCKNHRIEFLFIAGDLFDSIYVEKALLQTTQQSFRLCPETKVLIVPGNHDPYFEESYWEDSGWPRNVTIIKNTHYFYEDKSKKLRVYSEPFVSQSSDHSLLNDFVPPIDQKYLNILLIHGDLVSVESKSRYNPIPREWLVSSKVDLAILGHWHQSSELLSLGDHGYYLYPGALMGRGFDECGEKGFYAGTLYKNTDYQIPASRVQAKLNFIALQYGKWYSEVCNMPRLEESDEENIQDVFRTAIWKTIQSLSNQPSRDCFYITLEGFTQKKPDIEYLQFSIADEVFFLHLDDNTKRQYDLLAYQREQNIRGYVADLCLELRSSNENKSSNGSETAMLQEKLTKIPEESRKEVLDKAIDKLFTLLEGEAE